MARYPSKYVPRKSLDQIYNEYKTHFTTDPYGKWPASYKNQIELHRIESSPKTANPEYNTKNHNNELYQLYNELKEKIDINTIAQTIAERIESLREFSEQDTPRQLPTIELGEKTFFFDGRLWQLRNVENPHDFIDLRELEYGSGDQLVAGAPERKEQQHEIQPDKINEIQVAQDKVETSPKTEPYQETTEKPAELSYSKLGSPEYHAELGQADITERQTDIRARRRPGFDPLESGW